MLAEDEVIRGIISFYLREQFFPPDVPDNECDKEARTILQMVDEYLTVRVVNINVPSQSVTKKEDEC